MHESYPALVRRVPGAQLRQLPGHPLPQRRRQHSTQKTLSFTHAVSVELEGYIFQLFL